MLSHVKVKSIFFSSNDYLNFYFYYQFLKQKFNIYFNQTKEKKSFLFQNMSEKILVQFFY